MKKRSKIPAKQAQAEFTRTASRIHPKNLQSSGINSNPMRGGIRL